MKKSLLALALLSSTPAFAASLFNFEDPEYVVGEELPSPWTISHPGEYISFVGEQEDGSKFGAIGGYYAIPSSFPSTASITVTDPALAASPSSPYGAISFSFSLIDSLTGAGLDARNDFGFSYTDSEGNLLLSVRFQPVSQSSDPDTDLATWRLYYTVAGQAEYNTTVGFDESIMYNMYFVFEPDSVNLLSISEDFVDFKITDTPTNYDPSLVDGGTLTFFTDVGTEAEDDEYGTNMLIIGEGNALTVVPEPSVALLGAVASLGLLRRRRSR
jgi:hypothetical protein